MQVFSHARLFGFTFAIAVLLLAAGLYKISSSPVQYDFPLVRDVQKAMEDASNSTGAKIEVKEFVDITDAPAAATESMTSFAPAAPGATGLPPKVLIEVPFFVQAPTGNWNMPYQEACEESSIIMLHHFLAGTAVTPAEADQEILDMVEWENAQFNYSADITIAEAKQVAEDYYKHTGQLFYDFTIDDMKRLLADGRPIIVPLAGRDVGNPYYSGQGPWYHMLVVTGYDGNYFITNDVGTKRGHNYRYPQQRFFDAIHDWTGQKEDIRNGRKAMLVLEK